MAQIPLHYSDGSSNALSIFRSKENATAVVIIFPALGVKGSYYRHYATVLSHHGIHAVTIDHRGHGHSSVRPSRKVDFGYREQVEMEYPVIVEKVREAFAGCKIIIIGHSLGGQMGSMFVSRYHELVNGIVLNASCSVYYKGWGWAAQGILAFAKFSDAIAKALGYYPGNKIGFGGVEARGVIHDWYYTAKTGNFHAKGSSYDYEKAIHDCKLSVLGLTYQGDSSAPPASLKNLLHKFVHARVEYHHVLHPQFPKKKYDHYSWVKQPQISLPLVVNWINKLS